MELMHIDSSAFLSLRSRIALCLTQSKPLQLKDIHKGPVNDCPCKGTKMHNYRVQHGGFKTEKKAKSEGLLSLTIQNQCFYYSSQTLNSNMILTFKSLVCDHFEKWFQTLAK